RARASRKPAGEISEKTWACQASSSGAISAGLMTTSPANQDTLCPPASGTGRDPAAPKAASTAGGGNGTDRTYPTRLHRAGTARASVVSPHLCGVDLDLRSGFM